MLSRADYERVIKAFLVELNHLCINASAEQLQKMPGFGSELASYLADLRDPTCDDAQTLYTAFAFLDEYIAADWQKVAVAGYKAYLLDQKESGLGTKQA